MPHDVRSPHIFIDGPGNRASGDQVMDNFDAVWTAIDALAAPSVFQPGMIAISGGTALSGFLACDGAAVSRATYAALFAVIGTAFGAGDGSTTFNLPDLRGRAPIGAGAGSGLTSRTLGVKVGNETHTLATSEIPSHTHAPQNGSGAYFTDAGNVYAGGAAGGNFTVAFSFMTSTGGGGSHNNMQPSQAVNFWIKT